MESIHMWYLREVYLWRTAASITWYLLLLPVVTVLYAATAQSNLLHPVTWITETSSSMLSVYFFITVLVIMAADGILAWFSTSAFTVYPMVADTRIQKFLWLFRPARLVHTLLYMTTGFTVSWCSSIYAGDRFSRLVVSPLKESDGVYLNESHVVFILYGMFSGLYLSGQFYLCQLNYLQFPVLQREKFFQVRGQLPTLLTRSVFQTFQQIKYFYVLYFFLGHIPRGWMLYHLNVMLSPDHQPIDTIYGLLDLGLAWQLFLLGVFLNYSWSLSILLYTVYHTERHEFPVESAFDNSKNKSLMDAVCCVGIALLQYLGYLDLLHLARFSPVRRRQVFTLSRPGGHPHTWNKLSTTCLMDIDVLNNQVQDSNWRAMAGVAQRPGSISDTETSGSFPKYRGPTTSGTCLIDSKGSELRPVTTLLWKEKVLTFLAHKPILCYFFSPLPDAKSRQLFAKCQKQIWAVEALSYLVASSFKEDSYGVVQRSLPTILTSLLNLHENVEKHFKLCTSSSRRSQKDPPQPSDAPLRYQMQSTLKTSIYRIVSTFGKHLMDIPLSPECQKKLVPFMDFRE